MLPIYQNMLSDLCKTIKEWQTNEPLSALLSSERAEINSRTSPCTRCADSFIRAVSVIQPMPCTCCKAVNPSVIASSWTEAHHKHLKRLFKSSCAALEQRSHFSLPEKHFDSHFFLLRLHKTVDLV
jgi:hypothetical protein